MSIVAALVRSRSSICSSRGGRINTSSIHVRALGFAHAGAVGAGAHDCAEIVWCTCFTRSHRGRVSKTLTPSGLLPGCRALSDMECRMGQIQQSIFRGSAVVVGYFTVVVAAVLVGVELCCRCGRGMYDMCVHIDVRDRRFTYVRTYLRRRIHAHVLLQSRGLDYMSANLASQSSAAASCM